jgi:23S rRNA pseudouridine2605 synthase
MPPERLQKVLAAAGVASRRASEALIAEGRVTVDGRRAQLGDQVDPDTSLIEVDGRPVGSAASLVHVAVNKPLGVTSTVRDRHAERTVVDLIPTALVPDGVRLYPVGRLDQDSEGLLLVTNDGAWAERVLHPRFGVEREYAVGLREPLSEEQVTELIRGVPLDEGLARLAQPLRRSTGAETRRVEAMIDPPQPGLRWYRAVLSQGWKRQLRRMFAAVGAPIERLVRVRIGAVRLDERLPSGRARLLRADEIRRLGAGAVAPTGRGRDAGPRRSAPRGVVPRRPFRPPPAR